MEFKICIHDRQYLRFEIINIQNNEIAFVHESFKPLEYKLIDGDCFLLEPSFQFLEFSNLRKSILPGVLDLTKSYGRENKILPGKTYNKKSLGRLLYKFVPFNIKLPCFLVPYEFKTLDFSKALVNFYALVKFQHWDQKHPRGQLTQTIGPIDVLDNFYEYELYCKCLNHSIQQFTKHCNAQMEVNNDKDIQIIKKYRNFEDRTLWDVFTIDPNNTLDHDDAFSIQYVSPQRKMVSIYITNVCLWLDYFQLWNSFSERIATIYLPNRRKPMLPSVLTEMHCSLKAGFNRFAFTLDIVFNSETNEIEWVNFCNTMICVKENFVYEEPSLLEKQYYQDLLDLTQKLDPIIINSHDVVSFWMIYMNQEAAKKITTRGIFKEMDIHLAKYFTTPIGLYLQITSPLRRIVDIVNLVQLQQGLFSQSAQQFCEKWINNVDSLNTEIKNIKKVQNKFFLLDMVANNEKLLEKIYEGKIIKRLTTTSVLVYFSELKAYASSYNIEYIEEKQKEIYGNFQLYLFLDEERMYKKIQAKHIL
jgi:exoribonuclease R